MRRSGIFWNETTPLSDLERRALAGTLIRILAGLLVLRLIIRRIMRARSAGGAAVALSLTQQERELAAAALRLAQTVARLGVASLPGARALLPRSSVELRWPASDGVNAARLVTRAHEQLAADIDTALPLAAGASEEAACALLGDLRRWHAARAGRASRRSAAHE